MQDQKNKFFCKVCRKGFHPQDYEHNIRTCKVCIAPYLKKVEKQYNIKAWQKPVYEKDAKNKK